MLLFLILYSVLFFLLAWRSFRLAIFLFIIFLPSYLIRFDIGPLPSTILELSFGLIFLVWLIKYSRRDLQVIKEAIKTHKILFIFFALFFVASVTGVFVSDMIIKSLGQWRAYFLEPMILFLILVGRSFVVTKKNEQESMLQKRQESFVRTGQTSDDKLKPSDFIWALAFSTLSISILAIIQEFTGWGIATTEWASEATRRATAFYTSPNAMGLYLAPIIILILNLIHFLLAKKKLAGIDGDRSVHVLCFNANTPTCILPLIGGGLGRGYLWAFEKRGKYFFLLLSAHAILISSLLAIFFTKSQGTWIGLGIGMLVFLFLIGSKKIAVSLAIIGVLFSFLLPSMRTAILFKDKAGQNRLQLWSYSWDYLKASPKNFIFGAGIRQFFRKIQKPVYSSQEMERLIYPHNIFLNFWTETGLLGMLSFIGILGYSFYLANAIRKTNNILGASFIATLVVVVVHGLVDVPYFKNDLAMEFWIIIGLILISSNFAEVEDAKLDL